MKKFTEPRIIDCSCRGHILRLELVDWFKDDGFPSVYLSFWSPTAFVDCGYNLINRIRCAWQFFKNKYTADDFVIQDKEDLRKLRDTLTGLLEEWEEIEKHV